MPFNHFRPAISSEHSVHRSLVRRREARAAEGNGVVGVLREPGGGERMPLQRRMERNDLMSRIVKGALVAAATSALLAGPSVGTALADADAEGHASHSPGVLSGNVIQVPIHIPINVCGNTINVIGLFNPTV